MADVTDAIELNNIPDHNVGFTIIAKVMTSKTEAVVLGHKEGTDQYVSWTWNPGGGFYWGHYTDNRVDGFKEFLNRVKTQAALP